MDKETQKHVRLAKCPDCGFERYIGKYSKATGICKSCLPNRMKIANTLSGERLWIIRKDGRRAQGFINKCLDCGKERIVAKGAKNIPKRCIECNCKIAGENHKLFKSGIGLRHGSQIRQFKKLVFERDGKKCRKCGTDERLEVHHVIPWKSDKEKRYNPENGLVYCKSCHLSIEKTGTKASEETRKRLRDSHLGKTLPEEQKKKISEKIKHLRRTTSNYKNSTLRGSSNGNCKLTEQEVKEILVNEKHLTADQVAKKYGVGLTTIGNIRSRKIWKHVNID